MAKSVAVIGQGFVGGSLTTVLNERCIDVFVYDKAGKVSPGGIPGVGGKPMFSSLTNMVELIEQNQKFSRIYFVCLPTPMNKDGSANLSIVEGALTELANIPGKERIAVVKSTVPPGSTQAWNDKFADKLHVVFCPEFLTEANALDDMRNQDRIILGGPRPWINKVKQLFQTAFPNVPIIKTSSTNAELTKYVTNCFLALKVSFANELYQLCAALDAKGLNADYDRVVECATLDKRLGTSHWQVPGPMPASDTGEPAFGWAGSCFIKDVNALIYVARQLGIDPKVIDGAWQKNLEVRPQRDWEKLVGRAVTEEK
jgi:UDPglucose 6-dehydrogenase